MAALHTALASLSPTPFSTVPTSASHEGKEDEKEEAEEVEGGEGKEAKAYLKQAFLSACTVIDSVPLPSPTELTLPPPRLRSSTTTSNASNASEISASSARGDPLDPSNVSLQKEWGKPIKLSAKDNPLGMSVYKTNGKDGRGAWFARRSVHEGLGFRRWKLGLQQEFPESLACQGGPGDGNIRGIGGERRVESREVKGIGMVEGSVAPPSPPPPLPFLLPFPAIG